MTTTAFTPSSLSFGNVAAGSSVSQSVTAANPGTGAVSLSITGGGFSMSPSAPSVPAGGSVTVVVTFAPTAQTGYSGSISGSDGATGGVSGTGVLDPDQDASESAPAAASDVTSKYYQIEVPNFLLNASGAAAGNSFVRLGSFPGASALDTAYTTSDAMVTQAQVLSDAGNLAGGGWWDHTDGNRVTTTATNKVEVIQGNYDLTVNGYYNLVQTSPTTVTSTTNAQSVTTVTTAPTIVTTTYASTITTEQIVKGAITSINVVPEMFTLNVGVQETISVGAILNVTAGIRVANITAAPQMYSVNVGAQLVTNLGAVTTSNTGVLTTANTGAQFITNVGDITTTNTGVITTSNNGAQLVFNNGDVSTVTTGIITTINTGDQNVTNTGVQIVTNTGDMSAVSTGDVTSVTNGYSTTLINGPSLAVNNGPSVTVNSGMVTAIEQNKTKLVNYYIRLAQSHVLGP
jgi:hypothetical protein